MLERASDFVMAMTEHLCQGRFLSAVLRGITGYRPVGWLGSVDATAKWRIGARSLQDRSPRVEDSYVATTGASWRNLEGRTDGP